MSRSGYSCEGEEWDLIKWRGQVASTIRGKRGQDFLVAIRTSLLAMSDKRLLPSVLVATDGCCAMGAMAEYCKINTSQVDPFDFNSVANLFGVAHQLVQEIAYENDEGGPMARQSPWDNREPTETPEQRYTRMLGWVDSCIKQENK